MELTVADTRQGNEEEGYLSDLVPEIVAEFAEGELVDRVTVETEIDLMLRTVRSFWQMEPDQVFQMSSAMSARLTELCIHLHRVEGKREWKQIRTQQCERLLAEIDRQFKLHSRSLESRRQDLEELRMTR